jgi:hypothetical protein
MNQQRRLCRVISDYQAVYPDPIAMHAGETIEISDKEDLWNGRADWVWLWCTNSQGKSGWVPKTYLEQEGTKGIARFDYTAIELSVHVGEELVAEKEDNGWLWCTNSPGVSGWVPCDNVDCEEK